MDEQASIFERAIYSFFWRIVHPVSPIYRYCEYNGVRVNQEIRYCHLPFEAGSDYRPTGAQDIPGYEATLSRCLFRDVTRGDHVVVVGGGFGVTTVHAARTTGSEGRVTVYEASDSRFSDLAKAITHNETAGATIKPVQALVGEKVMVHGTFDGSERVDPASLPDCDVLQLDCEGAEREILDGLKISPRNILVETHGFRGAPTDDVRDQLESRGYQVTDEGVAEPRLAALCEERDIRVLAAERKS